MEIILDVFLEIYTELMMFIIPEKKTSSKWFRALVIVVAALAIFGIILLFAWGLSLIQEKNDMRGIIPIVAAVILSIAQIVAGFIIQKKK